MTDVTMNQGQDGLELSAADEQLLRELTERAPHWRACLNGLRVQLR